MYNNYTYRNNEYFHIFSIFSVHRYIDIPKKPISINRYLKNPRYLSIIRYVATAYLARAFIVVNMLGLIHVFSGWRVLIQNSRAYARCFNYVQFHQAIFNLASLFLFCHAWFCFNVGSFIFKQFFYLDLRIIISVINIKAVCLCRKYADTKLWREIKTSLTLSRILRGA